MSNALAIAAVTTTLRSLLGHALGIKVTTKPPDKARTDLSDQVNLFLYLTGIDAALRNTPPPYMSKPGETAEPPLALNLFYLVTAYGANDDDMNGHRLLGQAVAALHDHPLLDRGEIRDATLANLADSDLHTQVERVRITLQPLNLEEMSKLWMTFQTQFRISAAYQVSVVLIESKRAAQTPLPVLARGADDRINSAANVGSPFPAISSVETPDPSGANLGDTVVVRGANLAGTTTALLIKHQLFNVDLVLTPNAGATATEVHFDIPNRPADFPAGFYTVALEVTTQEARFPGVSFTRTTNRLAFPLAPRITSAMPASAARDSLGHISLTLTCEPEVRPEQHASLLLGDREVPATPTTTQTGTLTFEFDNPTPAESPAAVEYVARLRVDGVDSLLVDRAAAPPVFRNDQKVTIT